jgi:hypothetical protein
MASASLVQIGRALPRRGWLRRALFRPITLNAGPIIGTSRLHST